MTVQTVFRHVPATDELEELIRSKAAQLESLAPLLACRVLIDKPHLHHRNGNAVEVRIELSRPGQDIVATVEVQNGLVAAIDHAFEVARRRLEDAVRAMRDARRQPSS